VKEDSDETSADSERRATAGYEKWKYMGTAFPFRWAFTGLLFIAVAGIVAINRIWHTPYRPVGIGAGLLFLLGSANLFHDIPRRRLGLISRLFLSLGIAALLALVVLGMLKRVGAT
jgi:hypothetical protein